MKLFNLLFFLSIVAVGFAAEAAYKTEAVTSTVTMHEEVASTEATPKTTASSEVVSKVEVVATQPAHKIDGTVEFMAKLATEGVAVVTECGPIDRFILSGHSFNETILDVLLETEEETKEAIRRHRFGFLKLHLSEDCAGYIAKTIWCGRQTCNSISCTDEVRNRPCQAFESHSLSISIHFVQPTVS